MTVSFPRPRQAGKGAGATRLVLLVALILVIMASAVPAGTQDPEPSDEPPSIQLVSADPWVAVGDQFDIDITFPASDAASPETAVRINVHAPVDTPARLQAALDDDHGPLLFTRTTSLDSLADTESGGRRITLDISETVNEGTTLRLATPGVYPVVLTPIGEDGDEGEAIRTVVIRHDGDQGDDGPVDGITPVLGLLIDLTTAPTIERAGRRPFTDDEARRFERLADLVDRLTVVTTESSPLPFTVATTSDTVAGIVDSSQPAAHQLYEALVTAIATADPATVNVIAHGVGTVDIPDLLAAGLSEHVAHGAVAGRERVTTELGPVDHDRWFVAGQFDAPAAELLADIGYRGIIIESNRLVPAEAGTADDATEVAAPAFPADTPIRRLPEPLSSTVIDSVTSAWLTTPDTDTADRPDRAVIALAGLIVRVDEPDTKIAVTVRDLHADAPLATLLDLLTTAGSPIRVQPITDLAAAAPVDVSGLEYALATDAATDALVTIAEGVHTVRGNIASLTGMLADQTPLNVARELLAASLSAELSIADRRDLLDEAHQIPAQILGNISFTGSTNLNITSRRATLPIMFDNGNTFGLTAVVYARSDRLLFPEGDHITVELAPGVTRVDLPVEAQASGSVPLFIELQNPEGAVLSELRYNIRSTAISGVGLIVSGGALAVLIVWWARTWRNRRRDAAVS